MNSDRAVAVAAGAAASLLLFAFYLGIVTWAEGRDAAAGQLETDIPYLAFLVPGFGLQMGLYVTLRQEIAHMVGTAVACSSSATSATAMVACCAHFLPSAIPLVTSGAATVLAAWKAPLLLLGIAANFGGAAYMLWKIRGHARHQAAMARG